MVENYHRLLSNDETPCAKVEKVSYKFKPTEALSRFSIIPNVFAALMFVEEVNVPNFGLMLDYGHVLNAGGNPSQAATMALIKKKLYGVYLNDALHLKLEAEDGLAFASVNPRAAFEFIRILFEEFEYNGLIYFDTFPVNEDPVEEAERNVRVVQRLRKAARKTVRSKATKMARERRNWMELEREFWNSLLQLSSS